jgi:hypothetical protein
LERRHVTPDLLVSVQSPELSRERATLIAGMAWPPGALSVVAGSSTRRSRSAVVRRTSPGILYLGAHDILDDTADWNAETWLFDPAQLSRFVDTLRRMYELLPEAFELLAAWVGDSTIRNEPVNRDELLALITGNRLGNRILYRVVPA